MRTKGDHRRTAEVDQVNANKIKNKNNPPESRKATMAGNCLLQIQEAEEPTRSQSTKTSTLTEHREAFISLQTAYHEKWEILNGHVIKMPREGNILK